MIALWTDERQVEITACPRRRDWSQESFLLRWWIERKAGRPPLPWLDTPCWIEDGLAVIDQAQALRQEEAEERARRDLEAMRHE